MKVVPLIGTVIERHRTDNAREIAENVKAVQDYNIMMGNLEDPSEDVEESEEFDYE